MQANPTPRPTDDYQSDMEVNDTELYPDYFLAKLPVPEPVPVEEPAPESVFVHAEIDTNAQMAKDLHFSKQSSNE